MFNIKGKVEMEKITEVRYLIVQIIFKMKII